MALEAGVMSVTLNYAKDLKNHDFLGKQDPYCILRIGGQTFRSRTAKGAGRNPVWNETIRISLMCENDIIIEIMDEDLGRDDLIGSASVSMSRARQVGSDRLEVAVFSPKSRKQHGYISLALKWVPHRVPGAHTQPQLQWSPVQYGNLPQQLVPQGGPASLVMPPCYAVVPPSACAAGGSPAPGGYSHAFYAPPYMAGMAGPPGRARRLLRHPQGARERGCRRA